MGTGTADGGREAALAQGGMAVSVPREGARPRARLAFRPGADGMPFSVTYLDGVSGRPTANEPSEEVAV
jgi:hypothetical protein